MGSQKLSQTNMDLVFAPEDDINKGTENGRAQPWKVLIVDDEPGIHEVTHLSLKNFEFAGRGLKFLNAYSAAEAKQLLHSEAEIAVALIDVVMEREHAGLELVRYIREELNNSLIRLVLRTGHPGQAPERQVIRDYDINDYKEKTELTAQKLYTTLYTSLRSYRDLLALQHNRRSLEHIIHASARLFTTPSLNEFIQAVLEQMIALLYLGDDSLYLGCDSLAYESERGMGRVIAATGRFSNIVGQHPVDALEPHIVALVREALEKKSSLLFEREFVGYFRPREGRDDVIYISSNHALTQRELRLIELFLHNVSVAYENTLLHNDIEETQREMVYMLGEAIETRSRETGQHVRRVGAYCRLIAQGIGLPEHEAEILEAASPLHDFGKIAIPDGILHNPRDLNSEEWAVMKTHTTIGKELLGRSERPILKAASIIAGQHHEQWNGNGYPHGLKGDEIHIYGRISAIADVFDALGSKRCYKEIWPLEKIIAYLTEHRGKHFEPRLVDWILANMEQMNEIRRRYPDE